MTGESLFWCTTTTPLTKEEFEVWRSPEQTGLRLVESITVWMATALEKLPEEYRAWFRIDFDRPEWIDPEIPEQALHELHRLTIKMPAALPAWWELDREQHRAAAALVAIRDAVCATHGMDAPRALVLVEMATDLGFRLAQAHIEPWESRVEHRLAVNQDAGKRGGERKQQQAQERIEQARAIWEALDKPESSKAGIVALRMGIPADTVRRWKRNGWRTGRKADTS